MSERIILAPGFCYLEVHSCADTKQENGNTVKLLSKRGDPMLKVNFVAVDKLGQSAFVTDYFMPSYLPKIFSLRNALGLKAQFWNGKDFNTDILMYKNCGGVLIIENNETYGMSHKVNKYIPLPFFELMNKSEPEVESPAKKYWPEDVKPSKTESIADDDIPF